MRSGISVEVWTLGQSQFCGEQGKNIPEHSRQVEHLQRPQCGAQQGQGRAGTEDICGRRIRSQGLGDFGFYV